MAHFIPVGQPEDYHDSNAERMVYNAFRKLPNNYIVFYSLKWGREYDSRYQKGEADFLLFDPSRGFLVIEVKGGGIKKDDKGRWFSIDKSGYEHQLRYSPLDQAWRSARRFMDLLSDSSDRDIRRYPVIPTVWFPSVRMNEIQGDLPSDYQPSNTFTYPDLEDPEKAINLAFDYNNARRVPPEMATREKIDAVIQVFAPSFHIVPSVSIEKDSDINDEIEKLRHSATAALSERKDVIIVASVSCIYGLGSPVDYENQVISLRPGMEKDRQELLRKLVDIQYARNDMAFERGDFRVRGDTIDIHPAGEENAVRIELFGDEVESIKEINPITGEIVGLRNHVAIYPASHYVTSPEKIEHAVGTINEELEERIQWFKDRGKLIEAQRIEQRTRYDVEMLREIGTCKGVENYSRHLIGLPPGSRPYTLIDYFPDDFLIIIDESHVMLPQLRAMYNGDRSRKQSLVDYGFRLPSALDNRPLKFDEFNSLVNQIVYVSATPAEYERGESSGVSAEQIIRPTGLLDPVIETHPSEGQIDHLIGEIKKTTAKGDRVLITTLTKKMAESLTDYLRNAGIKVRYLHSEIDTLERMEIIRDLRLGVFDVLVGINLLREAHFH